MRLDWIEQYIRHPHLSGMWLGVNLRDIELVLKITNLSRLNNQHDWGGGYITTWW
jgi:hypothetical protein